VVGFATNDLHDYISNQQFDTRVKKSRNIAEIDAIGLDLYKQMRPLKKLGLDISLMMQKELAQSLNKWRAVISENVHALLTQKRRYTHTAALLNNFLLFFMSTTLYTLLIF
jgi:hypothetical protein